jgi:predicted DNA-binding protein (MmcQ/YjbR family)
VITVAAFRKLALALTGASEAPHFELASFRAGGKIFATLSEKEARAMVKLTLEQQELLTAAEPQMFQRIPNAWGDKGATWLHLKHADRAAAESALRTAWTNVTAAKPRKKATSKA